MTRRHISSIRKAQPEPIPLRILHNVNFPNSSTDQYLLEVGISTNSPFHWFSPELSYVIDGVPSHHLIGKSDGFRRPATLNFIEPGFTVSLGRNNFTFGLPAATYINVENSPIIQIGCGCNGSRNDVAGHLLDTVLRKFIVIRRALETVILIALFSSLGSEPLSARGGAVRPKVGATLSDFTFTDFAANQHRLSDFARRYVLLDFWATWCKPCLKEVPVLKKADLLYQDRGLEILGMDSDVKMERARKFVKTSRIPWLQSAPQSTKQIVNSKLKVKWYPTLILLDPQRRIALISGNRKSTLNGKALLEKLDQILPPATNP